MVFSAPSGKLYLTVHSPNKSPLERPIFMEDDYNDLYEYLSDKETFKFEPGEPITVEAAKDLCNARSKGNNFLAVRLKNKVIGHIYFDQIKPKIFHHGNCWKG